MPDVSFMAKDMSSTIKKVDATCVDAVPGIFRSVYGDGFPVDYVYHGDRIMEEISAGRLRAYLMLDAEKTPVGYAAAFPNAPNLRLWEWGNLMVVPEKGGNQLFWDLFFHVSNQEKTFVSGVDSRFTEAFCHHYMTQMVWSKIGFVDCAIALGQMNVVETMKHRLDTERITCLLLFREESDPIGECYLPEQYFHALRELLRGLRPRSPLSADAPLPVSGKTVQSAQWMDKAGMGRVSISSIGGDWGADLDEILLQAHQRRVVSLQVVLCAAMPYLSAAVERMRERGFFLGGFLPRWFGADGIMMQQVLGWEPDFEGIQLYGKKGEELLAFIEEDRKKVLAHRSGT